MITIDNRKAIAYNEYIMIKSFKHRGLEKLFLYDDPSGINPEHLEKAERILFAIDSTNIVSDLKLASYKLHPLKGNMKGIWSITVRANWRITFKFEDGNAYILNYEDYH